MVTRVCRSILLELKKSSPRTQVIYNNEPWIYIKGAIRNGEQSSHTMADLQNYLHYLSSSRKHVLRIAVLFCSVPCLFTAFIEVCVSLSVQVIISQQANDTHANHTQVHYDFDPYFYKGLLSKYQGRGERSIEDSARLVGLSLPDEHCFDTEQPEQEPFQN